MPFSSPKTKLVGGKIASHFSSAIIKRADVLKDTSDSV